MFFFFSSDNYPRERIKNKKLLKKKKFPEIVTFPFFPSSSPLPSFPLSSPLSFPLPLTPRQNFLDYPIFLFILYCIHDYSVQRGEPTTTRHFRNRIILAESRRSHRSKSSIWYIRYCTGYATKRIISLWQACNGVPNAMRLITRSVVALRRSLVSKSRLY